MKHMIETMCIESSDRVTQTLLPMWDSVRGLQGGVKDLQQDVKAVVKEVAGIAEQQVRVCVCAGGGGRGHPAFRLFSLFQTTRST